MNFELPLSVKCGMCEDMIPRGAIHICNKIPDAIPDNYPGVISSGGDNPFHEDKATRRSFEEVYPNYKTKYIPDETGPPRPPKRYYGRIDWRVVGGFGVGVAWGCLLTLIVFGII